MVINILPPQNTLPLPWSMLPLPSNPLSDVSSSEAEEPVVLPGSKPSQKSQKRKSKSTYTGDSSRFQFCKQKYWQTAKQGCGTLSDWFQASISYFRDDQNSTEIRSRNSQTCS